MNQFFAQPRRNAVLALFGYLGLAILMTWPAILRLSTEIVGGHDDLWIHQWTFWWIKQAIRYGYDIFYTDYLYYPDGVTLTSHNIAWFNIAVWLPLQMVVGQIPAYGLILITTFAVNGFALFLFARRVIKNVWAAFAGGVIFAFWPYTMSHNDHPNMIVLFWLPLSLLGLTNLVEKQRWRDVVITAFCIAMIGISRWQILIMSIPLLILYLLLLMWRNWNRRTVKTGNDDWQANKQLVGKLFSTVFLAGLLMAPLATPLLVYQFTREHPEDLAIEEPGENRTDILAYVTPLYTNSLWGDGH